MQGIFIYQEYREKNPYPHTISIPVKKIYKNDIYVNIHSLGFLVFLVIIT